jgi:hypothetical protein
VVEPPPRRIRWRRVDAGQHGVPGDGLVILSLALVVVAVLAVISVLAFLCRIAEATERSAEVLERLLRGHDADLLP